LNRNYLYLKLNCAFFNQTKLLKKKIKTELNIMITKKKKKLKCASFLIIFREESIILFLFTFLESLNSTKLLHYSYILFSKLTNFIRLTQIPIFGSYFQFPFSNSLSINTKLLPNFLKHVSRSEVKRNNRCEESTQQ
jgi:hypothetical protein